MASSCWSFGLAVGGVVVGLGFRVYGSLLYQQGPNVGQIKQPQSMPTSSLLRPWPDRAAISEVVELL